MPWLAGSAQAGLGPAAETDAEHFEHNVDEHPVQRVAEHSVEPDSSSEGDGPADDELAGSRRPHCAAAHNDVHYCERAGEAAGGPPEGGPAAGGAMDGQLPGSPPVPSGPHPVLDAEVLKEADRVGLRDRLGNLAGRPEATGVSLLRLLVALVQAGGLVNVAKKTLIGDAVHEDHGHDRMRDSTCQEAEAAHPATAVCRGRGALGRAAAPPDTAAADGAAARAPEEGGCMQRWALDAAGRSQRRGPAESAGRHERRAVRELGAQEAEQQVRSGRPPRAEEHPSECALRPAAPLATDEELFDTLRAEEEELLNINGSNVYLRNELTAKVITAHCERLEVEEKFETAERERALHLPEDQLAESQQKLIDASTEKLKLQIDKPCTEARCRSIQESLSVADGCISQGNGKVAGLEEKLADLHSLLCSGPAGSAGCTGQRGAHEPCTEEVGLLPRPPAESWGELQLRWSDAAEQLVVAFDAVQFEIDALDLHFQDPSLVGRPAMRPALDDLQRELAGMKQLVDCLTRWCCSTGAAA